MSFLDWLRNLVSGPPHVDDAGQDDPAELAAAQDEESTVAHPADDDGEPEPKPAWDFPTGGRR